MFKSLSRTHPWKLSTKGFSHGAGFDGGGAGTGESRPIAQRPRDELGHRGEDRSPRMRSSIPGRRDAVYAFGTIPNREPEVRMATQRDGDGTDCALPKIAARRVERKFGSGPSGVAALGPFDLDISDGEFVAIVGPS